MCYVRFMSRIKCKQGKQAQFLNALKTITLMPWSKLAKIADVQSRTFFDWRREKYTMLESAFNRLKSLSNGKITLPSHKRLEDLWYLKEASKKGGLALAKLYGGPGTPAGRRKGGINSQINRKLNPQMYRHCNIRKEIKRPIEGQKLAEFIGIFLGDGGFNTDFQIVIHLHKINDAEYAWYLKKTIKELFDIEASVLYYSSTGRRNVVGVTIDSVNVVEFLQHKGIPRGNKVKKQIDVPEWIKRNIVLSKNCMRGLMDTDGCVYSHSHCKGKYNFFNLGIQFSNKSLPLSCFVKATLEKMGFSPKINNKGVNLYREQEVLRYVKEVGFKNPHHLQKIRQFLKRKAGRDA